MQRTGRKKRNKIMTGRNKNMVCGALLCAMMLSMTACGNEIPDLTEEESQRIGEYAAVTLLKYDANNRSRLVDPEVVIAKLEKEAAKETTKASQEEGKVEETGSTGTTEVTMPTAQEEITASMEDFFGLPEGVSITYEDYMVADSYPEDGVEDDYFALDASMGKKLLVLRFHLTNGSEQEETIDLLNTNSRYIITVNDSIRANALTTMLPNDMSTYAETLEPGQSQGLVLLLEVNEDVADAVQTIALRLKNASNEYTIQLL
jgi:hypothetical protein